VKIYVYPADTTGCGLFRLIWPALILREQGHNVEIMSPKGRSFRGFVGEDDHLIDAILPDDADVVVLQRVTHRHIAEAVSLIRRKGIGVVVDIDDDLSAIDPAHPAFVTLHPNKDPRRVINPISLYHNWRNTELACDEATVVTVSSDLLLERYARRGHGFVIRNYLPDHYLTTPHEDSDVIGWGGSVVSHPGDLDTVGSSIRRLVANGHRFRVVGPAHGVDTALGISDVDAVGSVDITKWAETLTQLGIGIAPLRDTRFNAAKSWLKPLEYAGLGIPCVMSARREYREIAKFGIGVPVSKPNQWYRELRKLVTDEPHRLEFSARSREIAATLTIRCHAWRWAEAWTTAYTRDRRSRSPIGSHEPRHAAAHTDLSSTL
jgi:hypothetical protein